MPLSDLASLRRELRLLCVFLTSPHSFFTAACSWDHHSEFAVGLDWSVLREGILASAGWDQSVAVWHMLDPMVV